MSVRPISNAVPGEHVVGLHPATRAQTVSGWSRRLNLFPGRTLTAPALEIEQRGRAAGFSLRGQLLSPGVVLGLEASVETATVSELADDGATTVDVVRHMLHVGSGYGLAAGGEDVFLQQALRVNLADVIVDAPRDLAFAGGPLPPPAGPPQLDVHGGGRVPERLRWGRLGTVLAQGGQLPQAGILVLRPVQVPHIPPSPDFDPCGPGSADPCEHDPDAFAYVDQQVVDAVQVVLHAWPRATLALPPADARQRNRLAYAVFDAERNLSAGSLHPWEALGVPIGLIAFEELLPSGRDILWGRGEMPWAPRFVDRSAVVRQGGRRRRRARVSGAASNSFLAQARFLQLAEHLADPEMRRLPVTDQAARLRFLPPVGVLPVHAADPRKGEVDFFPPGFRVEAAPIPAEQLDLLLAESAGLAPYDLRAAEDEVRIYVPVPQAVYEPELLEVERVSPEFPLAIARFGARRDRWLSRRGHVRSIVSALSRGISGSPVEFPDPDPEAFPDEDPTADPIDPSTPELTEPELTYETSEVDGERRSAALQKLKAELRSATPLRHETAVAVDPANVTLPAFTSLPAELRARLVRRPSPTDSSMESFGIEGVMTDAELKLMLALSGDRKYQNLVRRIHARSQFDELSKLDELGLTRFIALLESRSAAADDAVDLGFTKAQTDIYRVRQLMLGTAAGTRLATSPALAQIAQGESARATRETLADFVRRISEEKPAAPTPAPPSGGGTTPSSTLGRPAFNFLTPLNRTIPTLPTSSTPAFRTPSIPGLGGLAPTAPRRDVGATQPRAPTGVGGGGRLTPTAARQLRSQGPSVLNVPPRVSRGDITQQQPIVGKASDFRNVSVAERLKSPPANESKSFSVADKYEVLTTLTGLALNLDGIEVPGFYEYDANGSLVMVEVEGPSGTVQVPKERTHPLSELTPRRLRDVLAGKHDTDPPNGDEGRFFAAGVRAIDHAVAALRLVEGVVSGYRNAIRLCRAALNATKTSLDAASSRLQVIDDEVAEARQDVGVARALLAEEVERVRGINNRRDRVVRDHVEFLVYQRSRLSDIVRDMPSRSLLSAQFDAPAPACLRENPPVPDELNELMTLLRDAPLRWFAHVAPWLEKLDRPEWLLRALSTSKSRAATRVAASRSQPAFQVGASRVQAGVRGLLASKSLSFSRSHEAAVSTLQVEHVREAGWTHLLQEAKRVVSLGDLMVAGHGQAAASQAVARELDYIRRVAACLYVRFGSVTPRIRLDWAERLGQYDRPANLRNLASLPRWGEISAEERRDMQSLVDWLFGRVDPTEPEAVEAVNDVVRMSVLLASHAPVDQILIGHVEENTPVVLGGRVDLRIDPTKVRVGMHVRLFERSSVVASATVQNIVGSVASTLVSQVSAPSVRLVAGARAQLLPSQHPLATVEVVAAGRMRGTLRRR